NFWYEARKRLVTYVVARAVRATYLEVGCARDSLTQPIRYALPDATLWATDALEEGLVIARTRAQGVTVFQADAQHLPFDSEFDLVGMYDVLEHIDDDVAVLREVARVLRPGGSVLLTVPQHPRLWSRT